MQLCRIRPSRPTLVDVGTMSRARFGVCGVVLSSFVFACGPAQSDAGSPYGDGEGGAAGGAGGKTSPPVDARPEPGASGGGPGTDAGVPPPVRPPPLDGSSGAAGMDGGAGAGGMPADSPDAAPPPPEAGSRCRAGMLLCDGFEGGAIDPARWRVVEGDGGEARVDSARAASGRSALRVRLTANVNARAFVRTAVGQVFPNPRNEVFGRLWTYVEPGHPDSHNYLMAAEGQLDGARVQYRLDSNRGRLNARYTNPKTISEHGGLMDFGPNQVTMPTRKWFCIEWHIDGARDRMSVWLDGNLITTTSDARWKAAAFEFLEIGFRTYQKPDEAPSYDVWYDDVALDDERIGCQ